MLEGNKMPTKQEQEESLPKGFLDAPGMCVLPSFYMPETEELRWATHYNVRMTLFFSIFRNVKFCEFKRLKSNQDSFELGEIEQTEEGLVDKMIETYWSKEKVTGKLLQTQLWTIKRTRDGEEGKEADGRYKVKIYHMDDDEFKGKIYPQSYADMARYLWFNRTYFRIL